VQWIQQGSRAEFPTDLYVMQAANNEEKKYLPDTDSG
jgi:hypothetical protein